MHDAPRLALAVALLAAAYSCHAQTTTVKILPPTGGTFSEALSTSFQIAPWTDSTFSAHPELLPELDRLDPRHINVQVIDQAIPETGPGTWDFTALDRQLQPILAAADRSPLLQLASAPAFLYRSKERFVTPAFIAGYAEYAATMVAHYDAPGAPHPIRYWGILNEPNYFHIAPEEYVALYNAAVPAMRAVDPAIKIAALELGGEVSDERAFLPIFVRDVRAPVDILAVHFYATCDQRDTDQTLYDTVPAFVEQLHFLRSQLQTRGDLGGVPIWILENNVNADFIGPNGESVCNPGRKFVEDTRGSSAFFGAWRAYEFSLFGQAGAGALYQWDFAGDRQYGEVNTQSVPAHRQIGFWVDLYLGRYLPAELPATLFNVANPDPRHLEVLAVRRADGAVVVLIANHTVVHATDNNGPGAARSIVLDLTALPSGFSSATRRTVDASTNLDAGPEEVSLTPARKIKLTLAGYGVTFVELK